MSANAIVVAPVLAVPVCVIVATDATVDPVAMPNPLTGRPAVTYLSEGVGVRRWGEVVSCERWVREVSGGGDGDDDGDGDGDGGGGGGGGGDGDDDGDVTTAAAAVVITTAAVMVMVMTMATTAGTAAGAVPVATPVTPPPLTRQTPESHWCCRRRRSPSA